MLGIPVLDVALILTITAFFKKQLGLSGWKVLVAGFVVALIIGLAPVFIATFPAAAPWLATVVNVIILFLAAAGSFDLAVDVKTATPPTPGL
jgi:hypothetical protein